jgi:N-acetylated-alpha-linked acidic dipeptidase
MYDSYELFKRFKDPDFSYGITLAKVTGRTTLRLANAEVLPFEFNHFFNTVNGYVTEVTKYTDKLRSDTENHNKLVADGTYDLASDPNDKLKTPAIKVTIPYINFAPIYNAMDELKKQANEFADISKNKSLNKDEANTLNAILKKIESQMTREHGLPRRPWYRHHIYAPGFYKGYGVKTLPGVREAIEQKDFVEAQQQVEILSDVLNSVTAKIKEAIAILKK